MSSEVQAKWINSLIAFSSLLSATFSFRKYSTAFTSWLVVRSISLMRRASSTENSATMLSSSLCDWGEKSGTSVIPSSLDSFCNHLTSTSTRYLSRPYSLKIDRNSPVLEAYRPSTGEIAVNWDSSTFCSSISSLISVPAGHCVELLYV